MGKEETKKEFLNIIESFKRLSGEMNRIVGSYYIWDILVFSRSIPIVGKNKAEKNAKTINDFKYFFSQVEDSLLKTFVIGILKFFDKNGKALSLSNLIKKMENIKDKITPEIIMEIYPDRFDENDVISNYPMSVDKDIKFIENLKLEHSGVIKKLKDIRDKQFAHIDIEIIDGTFIPNEIKALILATQEMFNKLSGTLEQSTTTWITFERESAGETEHLLEAIQKGEEQRKIEFNKKYGIKR